MYSDEWLKEFVLHYVAADCNATAAARRMGRETLGGEGQYYTSKLSCWANGSRLLRAAKRNSSFGLWMRDAEKAKAMAESKPLPASPDFGLDANLPAFGPLGAARLEGRAARFIAERAQTKETFPSSPAPEFDPRWPSWYDRDDVLSEFRGQPAPQPIKRLALSYSFGGGSSKQDHNKIPGKVGTWIKHTILKEPRRWER